MHADPPAPHVVVVAGPNGAGKSTCATELLRGTLSVTEFVNADVIAQGLSAFDPQGVALQAGRVMLDRLRELARRREDFAFETTLSGRAFANWLAGIVAAGYRFHLVFLWLPSADMAVERVASRVRNGGHHIPEETIRRRYDAGLRNFFRLYRPIATSWQVWDNSRHSLRLVATGSSSTVEQVEDQSVWVDLNARYAP